MRPVTAVAPVQHVGAEPAPDDALVRVKKKRKRKKHSVRKAALIVLIVCVCLLGVVGGAAALYIGSLNKALSFDDQTTADKLKDVLATADSSGEKPFYMLLLGSDAREGDTASRSDVMILTRVDPSNGQVTMVSIPRDTMIELSGHGRQKINAAYAFDGASGAVDAVQKFADVSINHYAEIHFEELEELVDSLGGVWVNVPVETPLSSGTLYPGEQLLNGEQALGFARERYSYERGDFQRTDNQRLLVEAIVKKVLALPALELPGTIQQLAGCVSTDLDVTSLITLAQQFQQANGITFYSAMVPSSTMTLDGVSYVITDYPSWQAMMSLVNAGEDPNTAQQTADTSAESTDAAADDAGGGEAAASSAATSASSATQ